jgi:DNA-binding NtrC family response regulator
VDSLAIGLQAKLLRLLQEKEFIRVGGDEVIPVDIRIISASNSSLNSGADRQPFRQDLYYRLSTLHLHLPPLTERKGDVALLFHHFLNEYDPGLSARIQPFTNLLVSTLKNHSFPGNLRELQAFAARFSCLCEKERVENSNYLTDLLRFCSQSTTAPREGLATAPKPVFDFGESLADSMKVAERRILLQALRESSGSVKVMAERLNLGRTTLWRKLKEHNLKTDKSQSLT